RPPVNLDDVSPFHIAEIGPATALVNPQERLQQVQGAAVDVKVVGQLLTDGGAAARLVESTVIPCPEEQFVGSLAGFSVRSEKCPYIPLERERQLPDGRSLAEPGQRQVHQKVFGPPLSNRIPLGITCDAPHQRESALQRAKLGHHFGGTGIFILFG